ncbi:MAG: nucleoside transporter C-terminal domain-containing protein [Candidatus Malihini olakiniferum]
MRIFDYPQLSIKLILSWLFSPMAFLIGIPWQKSTVSGAFIRQKLIFNEFVVYLNFSKHLKSDDLGLQMLSSQLKAIIPFCILRSCKSIVDYDFNWWLAVVWR